MCVFPGLMPRSILPVSSRGLWFQVLHSSLWSILDWFCGLCKIGVHLNYIECGCPVFLAQFIESILFQSYSLGSFVEIFLTIYALLFLTLNSILLINMSIFMPVLCFDCHVFWYSLNQNCDGSSVVLSPNCFDSLKSLWFHKEF